MSEKNYLIRSTSKYYSDYWRNQPPNRWRTSWTHRRKFASIPNQYNALATENIQIPPFNESEIPRFHPAQVWFVMSKLDTNKSTVPGDIPAKILKIFAAYFSEPLTHIFNTCIRRGEYPNIYKYEICTPIPKVYPTQTLSQLRNISGLFTFDKIFEKLLAELMISDMK